VGSSNLNLASLLGNWELDVAVTDLQFAAEMEALFERDLTSAVEVGLRNTRRVPALAKQRDRRSVERVVVEPTEEDESPTRIAAREARMRSYRSTGVARYLGRLARAASVLARALVGQRTIGREDSGWVSIWGVILLGLAALGIFVPRVIAWPSAVFYALLGIAAFVRIRTQGRGADPP
jgi:cardiolipin synthase